MHRSRTVFGAVMGVLLSAGVATAAILPFTEEFVGGPADWRNMDGNPLTWMSSGGPDGSSFVNTSWLVPDPLPPLGAILFRAHDEFGSSGGAFEGNWIAGGVTSFSFFVRHNAGIPIDVFARFAAPTNFPGAAGVSFDPVPPDIWTQITIPIFDGSPNIFLEGDTFENVFSSIGHVQIGLNVDASLIGSTIKLAVDRVSIVPAPAALLGLIPLAFARRRRCVGRAGP